MKRVLLSCALIGGLALPCAAQTLPQDGATMGKPNDQGMISIASKHSVRTTVTRLEQAAQAAGLTVFARIDHQANAEKAKLALRPSVLLLVGDPRAGTLLMHQNQTIALDLPLRFLVWESSDNRVYISWNNLYWLAQRHGIPPNFELLSTLSQNLLKLAQKAAG